MISAFELARWIVRHQRGYAFEDYTFDQVLEELLNSSEGNGYMQCIVSADGTVCGVVCGTIDATNKVLYVHNILTTKKGVFKQLFKSFVDKYPDHTIEATRKGIRRLRFTNPSQVIERIK